MRAAVIASLILFAVPAWAEPPPKLRLPLDCKMGETCWMMNYPDHDPGPNAVDFRCAARTYQGHDGSDFAVRDARVEVAVLAPAMGLVAGTRDSEPDGIYLTDKAAVAAKECGNGLVLRHHDGWETQLCHMRAGSLTVKPGELVKPGQKLGLVGMSGQTEFPHVHLSLRQWGESIDPFTGSAVAEACGGPAAPLWAEPVAYRAGAVYAAGFRDQMPTKDGLKADAGSPATLPASSPALVLWGTMLGIEAGDVIRLVVTAPGGKVAFSSNAPPAPKPQAWLFVAAGVTKRLAVGAWKGEVTLLRKGKVIETRIAAVEIRQ